MCLKYVDRYFRRNPIIGIGGCVMQKTLLYLVAALAVAASCMPAAFADDSTTEAILRRLEAKIDALAKDNATLRAKLKQVEGTGVAAAAPTNRAAMDASTPVGQLPKNVYAASYPVKAASVMPAPVFSWTGWYLGGSGGYGFGNSGKVTPTATGTDFGLFGDGPAQLASVVPVINGTIDTDPRGPLGGVQLGYNEQINRFVWGFEADYSWANINGSGTRTGANSLQAGINTTDVNITTVDVNEHLKSLGTIRGRIGFTPTERSLLYATGGLAYGSASSSTAISVVHLVNGAVTGGTFTPSFGSGSKTLAGWSVGAGGEWAFAPHWSVKAEYLYYDLGKLTYSDPNITLLSGLTSTPFGMIVTTTSARFTGSIARVGINYQFGDLFATY